MDLLSSQRRKDSQGGRTRWLISKTAKMRVLQWRRGRMLKVGLFGTVVLLVLIVLIRSLDGPNNRKDGRDNLSSDLAAAVVRSHDNSGNDAPRYLPHNSYPDEIPVFVGLSHLGNFEPKAPESLPTGPGEMGKSHSIRVDQRQEEENLKGVYGFNQLVSDEISLNRTVPDLREEECRHWDYPTHLPKASVVLVFHNEGWSTLLRTVNSVLNRSPPQFLEEVLLVDDKSELDHLHEPLEKELKQPYYLNRVRLIRNSEREGLIRSRNNGAVAARGDVVVFLDAHCEVNDNWLPPLLAPIHADR